MAGNHLNFDGLLGGPTAPARKEEERQGILSPEEKHALAEQQKDKTLLEIGRAYNKNMLIMGRTPERLYKGMKAGLPIEELFMIAVRGVAAANGQRPAGEEGAKRWKAC